jgi:D-arabinono-1,4-lactone oxidase
MSPLRRPPRHDGWNQLCEGVKPRAVRHKYHGRDRLRWSADRTDPGNCRGGRERGQAGQREKRRITVHKAKKRPGDDRRVEVRVAAADDIWLSTAYGRDTAYVAIHQYTGLPTQVLGPPAQA